MNTTKTSRIIRRIAGSVLSLSLVAGMPLSIVHAQPVSSSNPTYVFDSFNTYAYQPDSNGYWWTKIDSEIPGNPFGFVENTPCSPSNSECLLDNNGYLRFELRPSSPADSGYFRNIAVTDQRDGFSYSLPHKWLPTVNHPVLVSSRVRWSADHQVDGSGGALGSSGVFLWNLPADYIQGTIHPVVAIGMQWTDQPIFQSGSSTPIKGLSLDIFNGEAFDPDKLVYAQQVSGVNINDWNQLSYLWSVDASGVQSVKFFINAKEVGSYTLANPLPSLAIEMWADNEQPIYGYGQVIGINLPAITHTQDFDVTNFSAAIL